MPAPTASSRWYEARAASAPARVRLLCFHHAGGSAFVFRSWPGALGPAIGVVPIQLPGHGDRLREAPFRQLPPLIDAACAALRPLLDRPYALFGHSVGAAIAYEIARRFEQTYGLPAQHLFVAGRGAPDCPRGRPEIHHLPTPQLVAVLRARDGLPEAILESPEALELFMPILRADLEISDTHRYVPGPPLRCPITVFGGTEDPWVLAKDLQAWSRHTSGGCDVHRLPGGHFFVTTAREAILQIIDAHLGAGEGHARAGVERR